MVLYVDIHGVAPGRRVVWANEGFGTTSASVAPRKYQRKAGPFSSTWNSFFQFKGLDHKKIRPKRPDFSFNMLLEAPGSGRFLAGVVFVFRRLAALGTLGKVGFD
ncbi:MAG: hypothetical protein ABGW90_06600, partial [Martelella sp.]